MDSEEDEPRTSPEALRAMEQLKSWVKSAINKAQTPLQTSSVLVLPHLSDMVIFLVQETLKEGYPTYVSFVLGPEASRRVVICHTKLLQQKVLQDSFKINQDVPEVEVVESPKKNEIIECVTPTPPTIPTETKCPSNGKSKRPEKQLYVPVRNRQPNNASDVGANKKKVPSKRRASKKAGLNCSSVSESQAVSTKDAVVAIQPDPDDHWGCLDESHLKELGEVVGTAKIMKPEVELMDNRVLILLEEPSLGHIIEIYDFPASFSTEDLQKILFEFRDYRIKWVNDTTALLLFRDTKAASEVLTLRHPMIKLRPMSIASPASRVKVKRRSEFTLPYKERPQTVPTVARRLISFSLGLKPDNTHHVEEENILRDAREKKQLLKQKQDVES